MVLIYPHKSLKGKKRPWYMRFYMIGDSCSYRGANAFTRHDRSRGTGADGGVREHPEMRGLRIGGGNRPYGGSVGHASERAIADLVARRKRSRKSRGPGADSTLRPLRKRRDAETIERRSRKSSGQGADSAPRPLRKRRDTRRRQRTTKAEPEKWGQTVESAGRPLRKRRDTNTETIERRSRKEHGSQSAESATRDPRKPRKPETGTAAAKEDENGNGRSVYHGVWVPHTVVHGSLGNQGPAPTPLASDGSGNGRMVDSAPIQHTVHHENRGEPAPPSLRRRTSLPRSCAMQPRSKKRINRLPLRGVECLHIRPHGAVPDE
jgi:hypothetical protein